MLGRELVGVADHAEQALVLRHTVDGEFGVEDLVAAVFAVRLGEHHQFHIGGVALEAVEGVDEVVDLVIGQSQAKAGIRSFQRSAAARQHVHMLHRRGLQLGEQGCSSAAVSHHRFGHAVMQQGGDLAQLLGGQLGCLAQQARFQANAVLSDALDAADGDAAVARNVGGLGGPGRQGSQTGSNNQCGTFLRPGVGVAIGQQGRQPLLFGSRRRRIRHHQVNKPRRNGGDLGVDGLQGGLELLSAERAEGVTARQRGDVQGHGSGLLGCEGWGCFAGWPGRPP